MHLSLYLFNFKQWKDKCTSYSITTKKLTHSMCQVSLVVKYMYVHIFYYFSISRVGISGATPKLCKHKFVPSSHPGPFAVVASSQKRQTKVGTLACFDFFCKRMS